LHNIIRETINNNVSVSLCQKNHLNHEFEAKYSISLFGCSLIDISSFQRLSIYKIRILNEESISLVRLVAFAVYFILFYFIVFYFILFYSIRC